MTVIVLIIWISWQNNGNVYRVSEIKSALGDITVELNNVRSAWEWAVEYHKADAIETALQSLWFYYGVSTRSHEGKQVFEKAVLAFNDNTALHGKLMARWAELFWLTCFSLNEAKKAYALMEQSLKLLRQNDEREHIAFALYRLALFSIDSGINVANNVLELLEESFMIYTGLDNRFYIGEVLLNWSGTLFNQYLEQGQEEVLLQAQEYCQKARIIYKQIDSLFGMANVYRQSGHMAIMQGNYQQGFQETQMALEIYRDSGIPWGIGSTANSGAYAAFKLGHYDDARRAILENLLNHLANPLRLAFGVGAIEVRLRSLDLFAAILIDEGDEERGYQLAGTVEQQSSNFHTLLSKFNYQFINLSNKDLSPQQAAAVARGRDRNLEIVVREVVDYLSKSLSEAETTDQTPDDLLTQREIEIIQFIADGFNSREVAEQIHLSVSTVRWYLRQIYSKLDVHSRAELIAHARELKILA